MCQVCVKYVSSGCQMFWPVCIKCARFGSIVAGVCQDFEMCQVCVKCVSRLSSGSNMSGVGQV